MGCRVRFSPEVIVVPIPYFQVLCSWQATLLVFHTTLSGSLFICVPSATPESPRWKVISGLKCWPDAVQCPVWFQLCGRGVTYLSPSCWLSSHPSCFGVVLCLGLGCRFACSVFKSFWAADTAGLDSSSCDQTLRVFNPIFCSDFHFVVKPFPTYIA